MNRTAIQHEATARLYLAVRYHDTDRTTELASALRRGDLDLLADSLDLIDFDNYQAGADPSRHAWPGV